MIISTDIQIKRLIYRSLNRGCKETDYIFTDFALNKLESLNQSELDDYEKLLDVDDNILYRWFTEISKVEDIYNTSVFHKIKVHNDSKFQNI